jgi:hypothetical protein
MKSRRPYGDGSLSGAMVRAFGSAPVAWPAAVLATAIATTATAMAMAWRKEHPAATQAQGHQKGNQPRDSTKHR